MTPQGSLATLVAVTLVASLAGCASAPTDTPVERLDARTGTTVTALPRPAEFLATEPGAAMADPYAFAGPFETNEMGARRTFLWASTPEAQDDVLGTPAITCDGRPLELVRVEGGAAILRLSSEPYPPPTSWNSRWYFRLDAASLACLAAARETQLVVRLRDGAERRYASVDGTSQRFAEFRARVDASP